MDKYSKSKILICLILSTNNTLLLVIVMVCVGAQNHLIKYPNYIKIY